MVGKDLSLFKGVKWPDEVGKYEITIFDTKKIVDSLVLICGLLHEWNKWKKMQINFSSQNT